MTQPTVNGTHCFGQPEGLAPSKDYSATVNGKAVFVYEARASARATGEWWPGFQRPIEESELTAFINIELDGSAQIDITYHHDILRWVKVKPERQGVEAEILQRKNNEGQFRLNIDKPGVYVCEIDTIHCPVYVFANAPEIDVPNPEDEHVLYYGPGVHTVGAIHLKDGQHLYIAGGAVVYGYIDTEDAADVKISGRGVLDASIYERNTPAEDAAPHVKAFPRGPYLLHMKGCTNLEVSGIIIKDAPFWTFVMTKCQNVVIRNVKVVGGWRYNSDGIDVVNCKNVLIEESFIRAYDDCICLKGREETSGYQTDFANCEDITVRNCVLWNDWGVAIKVGTETMAREMCHMLFENIDILYYCDQPFAIQSGDFAHIHDITLRDIRIGDAVDYHIEPTFLLFNIYARDARTRQFIGYYQSGENPSQTPTSGIHKIHFENITNNSYGLLPISVSGLSDQNRTSEITFKNIRFTRFPEAKVEDLVQCNEFASV